MVDPAGAQRWERVTALRENERVSETLPLASGFPDVSEADWMAAVRGVVLKGRPDATDDDFATAFARQLVSTTPDGIDVQPLYTAGPEPSPAARGSRTGPWEIRQRVFPGVDGSSAVTELESGATGVLIELPSGEPSRLADALDGVYLDLAPISLTTPAGDDGVAAAGALIDLWDAAATPAAARAGTLGADPLAAWARTGGTTDLAAGYTGVAGLIERVADSPAVRVLVADGTVWHEAGATPAQELAWAIAAGAHGVRTLGDTVHGRIEFRWSADADQFTTIAKLRAARQLWARVADGAPAFHHVDASRAMLTRYDTWTNTLRSTVACFAGGVGGADAVTVSPHDLLVEPGGSPLGRRIARNTQTILQSESHLWRVLDPAGGSWYVESLTDQLAAAAWDELVRVDALGGLVAAVEQGHVHGALDGVLAARAQRLAIRAQPLTGLSEFPDIGETPPPVVAVAPLARLTEPAFPPFTLHRLAEPYEAQRARADQAWRRDGRRPEIVLVTLGTAAQFTARATFAKNLFEAGGIATTTASRDELATRPAAAVVCLCSSDAVYAEQGAEAAAAARAAGASRVYVAGRRLDLPGVDEEIGMGSDVLDVLARALDHLLGDDRVEAAR